MKLLTGLLLSTMFFGSVASAEELPPMPENLCLEVATELIIAVDRGYIDDDMANEMIRRCYKNWG